MADNENEGGEGAGAGGDGSGGGAGGDGKGAETITLTSAQLDARIARATKAANDSLIKGLGFEKADDLKAALKAKADADDAAKSDLERARETATAAEQRAAQAEARAKASVIRTAAMAAATKAGVPSDRIEHAIRLVDLDSIEVGDDGSVKGADEAVAALIEGAPWLKGAEGGTRANVGAGAGGGAGGASGASGLNAEQLAMAKNLGLTPEAYAAGLTGKPGTATHEAYIAGKRPEKVGAKQ